MERLVTPPRRGTSPTWGAPPPCEQALSYKFQGIFNFSVFSELNEHTESKMIIFTTTLIFKTTFVNFAYGRLGGGDD